VLHNLKQVWQPLVLAVLSGCLGTFVAWHHPLWPGPLTLAFALACLAFFRCSDLWPLLIPGLLPLANWSPWTGWMACEEFDLLVLAAATGGHARLAAQCSRWRRVADNTVGGAVSTAATVHADRLTRTSLLLLTVSWMLALVRGLLDVGALPGHWFEGYEEPLNSLRIAKSFLLVLLLLPLLRRGLQTAPERFARRLAAGVATGLALVSLAVVWERAGYPGIFDFSTPYRATALFWEMHVGGAAVDGFLILSLPFSVYAALRAPNVWLWLLAAVLALLTGYACLTTFSRVVYGGATVVLSVLFALLSNWCWLSPGCAQADAARRTRSASPGWRVWGNRVLLCVVALEVVVVVGLGDFMRQRLSSSEQDLGGRLQHWREAVSLLRDPGEVLFGRGLGRFPASYSQTVVGREMPGRLRIVDGSAGGYLFVHGTTGSPRHGALELLQRVPLTGDRLLLVMDVRTPEDAILNVGVCRRHLLYDAECVRTRLQVAAGGDHWRRVVAPLATGELAAPWWQRVSGFFVLRLEGPAKAVDIDNVSLRDTAGDNLIDNGSFASGMAHWFFAGRHYFVPWHVDNLLLEVLIEQGALGLLLFMGLLVMAATNLVGGRGRGHWLAPYLLAALIAALAIGVFVSLLDMPRTAFLFFLFAGVALHLDGRGFSSSADKACTSSS